MTYLYVLDLPPRRLFDSGAYYTFKGTSAVHIRACSGANSVICGSVAARSLCSLAETDNQNLNPKADHP